MDTPKETGNPDREHNEDEFLFYYGNEYMGVASNLEMTQASNRMAPDPWMEAPLASGRNGEHTSTTEEHQG